ncbi:MAG: HD domain-containing protein [Spirochaetes bacterium]|nr:HD domain-containing protein [Spirochaetota bacterium]
MWKEKLIEFSKNFNHPAWGFHHSERVMALSIYLAEQQKMLIDQDIITAASFLHDIGAFNQYRKADVDHSDRSAELITDILTEINFPTGKIPAVQLVVEGHMFYRNPSDSQEAIIFHDADTLDFMGYIGITRLISIVGMDDWTPDVQSAITLIKDFSKKMLSHLQTPLAQQIGQERKKEMDNFLEKLSDQTCGLKKL